MYIERHVLSVCVLKLVTWHASHNTVCTRQIKRRGIRTIVHDLSAGEKLWEARLAWQYRKRYLDSVQKLYTVHCKICPQGVGYDYDD